MKSLIERQLYRPALVLPLMGLTRLLVSTDFNLTQAGFVIAMRGSQQMLSFSAKVPAAVGTKARQWAQRRAAALLNAQRTARADRTERALRSNRSTSTPTSAALAASAAAERTRGAQPSDCCHCGC